MYNTLCTKIYSQIELNKKNAENCEDSLGRKIAPKLLESTKTFTAANIDFNNVSTIRL